MGVLNKKERIAKLLKSRRFIVIAAVAAVTILVIAGLLFVVRIISQNQAADSQIPALQVGETKLTTKQYDTLLGQAKEQQVSEEDSKAVIVDATRLREVARKLKIAVPDWLVAAQQSGPVPVMYSELSDYEKTDLYIPAFYVAVELTERGGSLSTVLHAPYSTSGGDSGTSREAAEFLAQNATRVGTDNATTVTTGADKRKSVDPIRELIPLFWGTGAKDAVTGTNKTQTLALTNESQQVIPLTSSELNDSNAENANSSSYVTLTAFDQEITSVVASTAVNTFSKVTSLSNPPAYLVVHKDTVYAKDADIRTKITNALKDATVK